jgi:hypothetical protein
MMRHWRIDVGNPTWVVEDGAAADGGPGLVAAFELEEEARLVVEAFQMLKLALRHLDLADSDISWMLHRDPKHWNRNALIRGNGDMRAFTERLRKLLNRTSKTEARVSR